MYLAFFCFLTFAAQNFFKEKVLDKPKYNVFYREKFTQKTNKIKGKKENFSESAGGRGSGKGIFQTSGEIYTYRLIDYVFFFML